MDASELPGCRTVPHPPGQSQGIMILVMFNKKRGLTATVEWSLISNCTMIRIRSFCKSMELEGLCPKDRLRICKWTGPSAALCVGPSHRDGGLETSLIAARNGTARCLVEGEPWALGPWLESGDALPIQTRKNLQRVCTRTVPEKQGHRRHCRIRHLQCCRHVRFTALTNPHALRKSNFIAFETH